MKKISYREVLISLFCIAVLFIGYEYVQDEKYAAWANCWEWADGHDDINPNWLPICDAVMTHRISTLNEPTD